MRRLRRRHKPGEEVCSGLEIMSTRSRRCRLRPQAREEDTTYTLIQGPPGTGKTSLAIALLRLMREQHQGPSLAGYHHNVVCVRDGCFDGLSAVGVASNKKNRDRAAHMALTVACLT